MAVLDFILQAVTKSNHAESVRALLKLSKPTRVLVSVAFARSTGVASIQDLMKPLADRTKVFVGIRNDITSIQAVRQLLSLKVDVYAVDTGSRNIIFHPKLYLAANATKAVAIIGSANMTFRGLHNNIEVSTQIELDLVGNPADLVFADSVFDLFGSMLTLHPQHVFKIGNGKHADQLFDEGRLADERIVAAPSTTSSVRKGVRDTLAPMKLNKVQLPKLLITPILLKNGKSIPKPAKAKKKAVATLPKGVKYLVWESKPLSERDLSIPKGTNTNPTGSMGLKKGLYDQIDQRHYFYDEVFSDLVWTPDKPGATTLRAKAQIELVVKNVSYGKFEFLISHKTDVNSASYLQNNFMTQLHWGQAKPLIATSDLLGRNLYLYRKDTDPPEFMIEID